jgi:hypothetical protein
VPYPSRDIDPNVKEAWKLYKARSKEVLEHTSLVTQRYLAKLHLDYSRHEMKLKQLRARPEAGTDPEQIAPPELAPRPASMVRQEQRALLTKDLGNDFVALFEEEGDPRRRVAADKYWMYNAASHSMARIHLDDIEEPSAHKTQAKLDQLHEHLHDAQMIPKYAEDAYPSKKPSRW